MLIFFQLTVHYLGGRPARQEPTFNESQEDSTLNDSDNFGLKLPKSKESPKSEVELQPKKGQKRQFNRLTKIKSKYDNLESIKHFAFYNNITFFIF